MSICNRGNKLYKKGKKRTPKSSTLETLLNKLVQKNSLAEIDASLSAEHVTTREGQYVTCTKDCRRMTK